MSGETQANISSWTVDTLHETLIRVQEEIGRLFVERDLRYQQRFAAQQEALTAALSAAEKAVTAALIAADRAVAKAELATDKRFESVNEFRKTLADQVATFMTRAEADARFNSVSEKIDGAINSTQYFVRREEHDSIVADLRRVEMSAKDGIASTPSRSDLIPINEAITRLRDSTANSNGKSAVMGNVVTAGIAIVAIIASLATAVYANVHTGSSSPVPESSTSFVTRDDLMRELQLNRQTMQDRTNPNNK